MSAWWSWDEVKKLAAETQNHMRKNNYADFEKIGKKLNRSAKACELKAYDIGVPFNRSKPKKDDMVNLPLHKSGQKVNYGGVA
jgi:hypothetical protein